MKTIDWDSLTFANNYVFQEVLKNKKLCKYLIERILHIQIKDIRYLIAERHINSARISSKSIRLDVYVENQEGTVLDIEMQVTRKSYVIFICTFDPFGKGLPMYHFTYRCKEDNTLEMGDLTENIYLNARAADKAKDTALADFLCYVISGKAGSEFTQAIDAETKRVTNDEDWRERYVTWEMDLKIIQEDAEKKGEKKKALAIAKSLKEKGKLSDSEIAEVTALPLCEVAAL